MALLSYEQALTLILENADKLDTVTMPTVQSLGRRLATPVSAAIDLPVFDNSQMDGYAVISKDLAAASEQSPVSLAAIGTTAAGSDQSETLLPGQAVKIFTGAPLPFNGDAVVPIEDVIRSSDSVSVTFTTPVDPGQFVRYRGEDVRTGDVIGEVGDELTPGRLALLISAGCVELDVYRQPRVVILANGDELVPANVLPIDLSHGQIYESNSIMLAALVGLSGCKLVSTITSVDSRTELTEKLIDVIQTENPDVILSTGGVSVGDRDFIRSVLTDLGEIIFWRSAIRPGKPILYGKIGTTHFLGLPGNPASTMVTFEIFARPLLNNLIGSTKPLQFYPTIVTEDISHGIGRRSFVRAVTKITASGLVSAPAGAQGSHYVTSLSKSNSLIIMPETVRNLSAGSRTQCLLTGTLLSD